LDQAARASYAALRTALGLTADASGGRGSLAVVIRFNRSGGNLLAR
jgi:hypothetical protein